MSTHSPFPGPYTHDGYGRIIGADGFQIGNVDTSIRILPNWETVPGTLHWAHTPGVTYLELDDDGEGAALATADLFAAAPDLLLACKLVKSWCELHRTHIGPVIWFELNRAIAKAEVR